ncbi:hypothetical protein TrRE_jg5539 [Triparma retinervis]|uniref:Uncharacterized protein n=1 Tax=Triparma retinervis TaxID=2557542 RepID=A0A9W6ZMD4_9STRA|nr:hypothetical protein TrRE_jg5539 [Triparma retinervis]
MKKSRKSSGSSVKSFGSNSVVSEPKDRRTATRDALLASRRTMRSSSPSGNEMSLDPANAKPLDASQGASGITPPPPELNGEGKPANDMSTNAAGNISGQGQADGRPLTLTTLDVAQSAERLMMSGYKFDIDENLASNPGASFQTAPENLSDAIHILEALHLTLMLRRTLSELDSRSKHLNDSNLEKLQLHGEVEKCKVRLERLTIESEELQRRTEAAELRARSIIDDEAANVNGANARATAAEKRFEILVDWSRKEESKRMVAEETVTRALEKMERMERTYNEQVACLNSEVTELSDALDKVNATVVMKHKALVEKENELLECTKKLAVAEQLSRSSTSESVALKNLCGKIEVELEGTKSRLGSVEQAHMRDAAAMNEEVKGLAKDNKRLSEQAEEAIAGMGQQVGHWKKVNENNERKLMAMLQEKEEWARERRRLEGRMSQLGSSEKTYEEKIDFLANENEELKKKVWMLEQQIRDKDLKLRNQDSTNKDLLKKNESLNRMVDGLEDDMMGKSRATGMHQTNSPSLLRYDIKPVY